MKRHKVEIKQLSIHPNVAALVTPLRLRRKEGIFVFFLYPLSGEAGERVAQRSVDRVSRLCDLPLI
jgi:hypothetical protein